MTPETSLPRRAPALVVFVDGTDLLWLRLLKRGFRHCFVAVRGDAGWVICDPLSHRTDLHLLAPIAAADLGDWYRSHGLEVVETEVRPAPRRMAPIRPFTCVEAVKRILGLHAPTIFTPWQLYRRLREENTTRDGLDTLDNLGYFS